MKYDDLSTRMKSQYEDRTRYFVPRRTYTIIRLDGKCFSSYTRGLNKPFDNGLSDDMDSAIMNIMPQIQGAKFAYTQSDEISILLTDFEKTTTSAWFDGNIQKMASVAASLMTAHFNLARNRTWTSNVPKYKQEGKTIAEIVKEQDKLAYFDARVFTIPDRIEVMNYLIWRNQGCTKNSISMVAQSEFPHNQLQNKNGNDMINMLIKEGRKAWDDYSPNDRYGRMIINEQYINGNARTRWTSNPAWKFSDSSDKLLNMIPKYE